MMQGTFVRMGFLEIIKGDSPYGSLSEQLADKTPFAVLRETCDGNGST